MEFAVLLIVAFGLAMDAFAVSVTNGMCYRIPLWKNTLSSALAFGFFQGAMPLVGYFAGSTFSGAVEHIDHWIAFALLGFIGGHMIHEAFGAARSPVPGNGVKIFSGKTLLLQAVATSIDALAVGVSFGVMQVNVGLAVSAIAAVTFCCSFAGVVIGKMGGKLFQNKAELLGGVILVFIGAKILLEHLFT